jgi:flagellar basal body-associated protein FliL
VKSWLKILLVVIVVLVFAAGVAAIKMFGPRAFVGPRSRPLTSRTFQRTPARLERGSI